MEFSMAPVCLGWDFVTMTKKLACLSRMRLVMMAKKLACLSWMGLSYNGH